jgi:N-formylglutamate deformylase
MEDRMTKNKKKAPNTSSKKSFDEIVRHASTRDALHAGIKSYFGDKSPYIWGDDREIDWQDGWWTSIREFIDPKHSEDNQSYTFFRPDHKDLGTEKLALVFDSPHSGHKIPEDFKFKCDEKYVRRCSDSYIDSIIQDAVLKGVDVLKANFPRSYIDLNRPEDCLTGEQFNGGLSAKWPVSNDSRAQIGYGLIWMSYYNKKHTHFYPRREDQPTEQDLKTRLEHYYRPYHRKLQSILDETYERHGMVYYVDWHSCPRTGKTAHNDNGKRRADFILGDRKGTTCDPVFVQIVTEFLHSKGYSVALNKPYQGAELIMCHGKPKERRYSLQIEICRDLYMDQNTHEPHQGIHDITRVVQGLTEEMKAYVLKQQQALQTKPETKASVKPPRP